MVRKRDQTGASGGLRRTKGGVRSSQVLCGLAGPILRRSIIQAPHATLELSRWCRARRGISNKYQQKVLELSWILARFEKISNLDLDLILFHVFRLRDCLLVQTSKHLRPKTF